MVGCSTCSSGHSVSINDVVSSPVFPRFASRFYCPFLSSNFFFLSSHLLVLLHALQRPLLFAFSQAISTTWSVIIQHLPLILSYLLYQGPPLIPHTATLLNTKAIFSTINTAKKPATFDHPETYLLSWPSEAIRASSGKYNHIFLYSFSVCV